MNTQEREAAFVKFVSCLQHHRAEQHRARSLDHAQLTVCKLQQNALPRLDPVKELIEYHRSITTVIDETYSKIHTVVSQINELKSRRDNVQVLLDIMTAMTQVKKLSFGLGVQLDQIIKNLTVYYNIKSKVFFMDRYVQTIEKQIIAIEVKYREVFDVELSKGNSSIITQVSTLLQLIKSNSQVSQKVNTVDELADFYIEMSKKQFLKLQQQLFKIPLVGHGSQSSYIFFDLAKNAMKIVAQLIKTYQSNIMQLSGEDGLRIVIQKVFQHAVSTIILQVLARQKRFLEVDKITLEQKKFCIKEKDYPVLKNYFPVFNAIWNQLERLRLHLIEQLPKGYQKMKEFHLQMQNIVNSNALLAITSENIRYMQAFLRFQFQQLLKRSPFINSICQFDNTYFKTLTTKESLQHNSDAMDFLEQSFHLFRVGIDKSLETLNLLIASGIINFTNHNLLYEDTFYAFNQIFNRCLTKLPSGDLKPYLGLIVVFNTLSAIPSALQCFAQITVPALINQVRIQSQIQQLIDNNSSKANEFLQALMSKVVNSDCFMEQLSQDYQKIFDKWKHLEKPCYESFVQKASAVHAEILISSSFDKKYTQAAAFALEKEIRAIITSYELHSHSILPNFQTLLEYVDILHLETEKDMQSVLLRSKGKHDEKQIRRIWSLRV